MLIMFLPKLTGQLGLKLDFSLTQRNFLTATKTAVNMFYEEKTKKQSQVSMFLEGSRHFSSFMTEKLLSNSIQPGVFFNCYLFYKLTQSS